MIVRLKDTTVPLLYLLKRCFNSMIVRLKGLVETLTSVTMRSFNSMIVRLKALSPPNKFDSLWFQFYDSPIKRKKNIHRL